MSNTFAEIDVTLMGRMAFTAVYEQEASFLDVPACYVTVDMPAEVERPGATIEHRIRRCERQDRRTHRDADRRAGTDP